ncbi:RNA polymerase subunit sigma [Putridiphycobacter roseus]|uniref:RNA polymerase subunit sigma n=1 Tax=Putridiphycobacter roseus TaxID=2219161 RepID=A0A2W1MVF0_9FLAO|nr:sigma-70 family RNA polymerase sigma factor [Putridiphycobacter roseus]PZE16069.1 RNA polymerase subunit sigma [Putridiphycobacter roseus]
MQKIADKDLLDQFKVNPQVGFKLIVNAFQERVYWQIRRMTRNHEHAEDIMQNVFIKAWKALPNFKAESAIYSWLYRIAYNETITFLNKENKNPTLTLDDSIIESGANVNGKDFSSEEISEILMNAIATLPEKQAQIFQLKYFEDLKYQEISDLLGTSVGGLKASYHIAVKKIETFIQAL